MKKQYSSSHGSKVAFASAVKLDLGRKTPLLPLVITMITKIMNILFLTHVLGDELFKNNNPVKISYYKSYLYAN